jgi:Trehalose utilisation/Ricin-type beta-trefoil lectin domain
MKSKIRGLLLVGVLLCGSLLLGSAPATAHQVGPKAARASQFKVLAFYSGNYDDAHISYDEEALRWFPQVAAQNNFSFEATTDWSRLSSITPAQYQVVMFWDDNPATDADRTGFQNYMQHGGAFFGFHVSAYADSSWNWPWFNDTFLGTGFFDSNTWQPSTAILHTDASAPATRRLPATWMSGVSEWYSWANDLRQNPDIQVLASVDPSSFPLGNQEGNIWTSGYYPILWTNKNYKMLYANFGHNAMNYSTKTALSSTFAAPTQDKFIIDGLLWLGGGAPTNRPTDQISPRSWFSIVSQTNGKCVDVRRGSTAIQQDDCIHSPGQQFRFRNVTGPYLRVNNRFAPTGSLAVTDMSTADNAPVQLERYSGGRNEHWQAVADGDGLYHFVNRNSQKCLTGPDAAATGSTQLVQLTCTGVSSQSFKLVPYQRPDDLR